MVKIRTEMNETGDVFLLIATSQMSIIILIITTQTHCMLCNNVCTLPNLEIQKLVTGEIGNNVYFYIVGTVFARGEGRRQTLQSCVDILGGKFILKDYDVVWLFCCR